MNRGESDPDDVLAHSKSAEKEPGSDRRPSTLSRNVCCGLMGDNRGDATLANGSPCFVGMGCEPLGACCCMLMRWWNVLSLSSG